MNTEAINDRGHLIPLEEELREKLFRREVEVEGFASKEVEILTWEELPEDLHQEILTTIPPVFFRAHSSGNLMVGGNEPTETQVSSKDELQARKDEAEKERVRVESEHAVLSAELESLENILAADETKLLKLKEPKPSERDKDAVIMITEAVKAVKVDIREKKKDITANKPTVNPLTDLMERTLEMLNAKISAPFEFGKTTLSYIRRTRRRREYGFDEPVASKEMIKGLLCEDEAIGLVSRVIKEPVFRRKNKHNYRDLDGYFTGTPDVVLEPRKVIHIDENKDPIIEERPGTIEDVKTSWNLRTFDEVDSYPEHYFAQAQIYMYLTGYRFYRLIYCLVDTPWELVEEEKKKFFFKFGSDESPEYILAARKLDLVHTVSDRIPEEDRIKVFEFDYDEAYIEKLKGRVDFARLAYDKLKLVPDHLRPSTWEPTTEPPF